MRRSAVLGLRSITGVWSNRGLAWKAGFSMGIILSGATMMAAYVGIPRQLQTGAGGSYPAAFSFQNQSKDPSRYRTHGITEAASQPLQGVKANHRIESNASGPDSGRIDTSNCQAYPPERMNSGPLAEGMYRIYLPPRAKDGKGTPENPTIPFEVFRCSIGEDFKPAEGRNSNIAALFSYFTTARQVKH
jgi:hypothetical protein